MRSWAPVPGADNPLITLARYGLRTDVPPAAPTPDGAVVRNLMMLWSRLVGDSARH